MYPSILRFLLIIFPYSPLKRRSTQLYGCRAIRTITMALQLQLVSTCSTVVRTTSMHKHAQSRSLLSMRGANDTDNGGSKQQWEKERERLTFFRLSLGTAMADYVQQTRRDVPQTPIYIEQLYMYEVVARLGNYISMRGRRLFMAVYACILLPGLLLARCTGYTYGQPCIVSLPHQMHGRKGHAETGKKPARPKFLLVKILAFIYHMRLVSQLWEVHVNY